MQFLKHIHTHTHTHHTDTHSLIRHTHTHTHSPLLSAFPTDDYGHSLGCYSDILNYFDAQCSGREACRVVIGSLDAVATPCPKDFKSYLEASYSCIPGQWCIALRSKLFPTGMKMLRRGGGEARHTCQYTFWGPRIGQARYQLLVA